MSAPPLRIRRRHALATTLLVGCGGGSDAGPDASTDAPPGCAPTGYVRVGPVEAFVRGRWVFVDPPGVIVGRDAAGVFVYSGVCTHSGCTVPAPDGPGGTSVCPCHQSTFSDAGRRLSGPARSDLPHHPALVCDGVLYADIDRTTGPETRVAGTAT